MVVIVTLWIDIFCECIPSENCESIEKGMTGSVLRLEKSS